MLRTVIAQGLPVIVGLVLTAGTPPRKEEPKQMRPGETIHVADQSCGQGFVRRVSVEENGVRKRVCVKWSPFPAEIYGAPIR